MELEDWTVPSRVLEIALKDFKAADKDPNITLNMDHFIKTPEMVTQSDIQFDHDLYNLRNCHCCLAGAVIIGTVGIKAGPDYDKELSLLPIKVRSSIFALDRFRMGFYERFIRDVTGRYDRGFSEIAFELDQIESSRYLQHRLSYVYYTGILDSNKKEDIIELMEKSVKILRKHDL